MSVNTKIAKTTKNVGRPAGVIHDRPFQMRVNDEFLALVDSWRKAQPIMPTRTEAIRQMVEIAARQPADRASTRKRGAA
jgi:hypothetical protein